MPIIAGTITYPPRSSDMPGLDPKSSWVTSPRHSLLPPRSRSSMINRRTIIEYVTGFTCYLRRSPLHPPDQQYRAHYQGDCNDDVNPKVVCQDKMGVCYAIAAARLSRLDQVGVEDRLLVLIHQLDIGGRDSAGGAATVRNAKA